MTKGKILNHMLILLNGKNNAFYSLIYRDIKAMHSCHKPLPVSSTLLLRLEKGGVLGQLTTIQSGKTCSPNIKKLMGHNAIKVNKLLISSFEEISFYRYGIQIH